MLEVAGVGPQEERVYRLLVATFDATPATVAEQLGMDAGEAAAVLESLRAKGLASLVSESAQGAAAEASRHHRADDGASRMA
jgi:sugar-specific transcriptional regulator TrmB